MNTRAQEPAPASTEISSFWSQCVVVVDQSYGPFPSTTSLFWYKSLNLVAATLQDLGEGESVQLYMEYEQYAGGPTRTAVLGRFDDQHMSLDLKDIKITSGERVIFHALSSYRGSQGAASHDEFRTVCIYGQAIENDFWTGVLKSTLVQRYWPHAALTASGMMWVVLFIAWVTALLVGGEDVKQQGQCGSVGGGGSSGGGGGGVVAAAAAAAAKGQVG